MTSYDNKGGKISITERAHSPEAKYGEEGNLRTVSRYYPGETNPAARNKLKERISQTGEVTRYTYTYGDYLGLEAVPGDFQPADSAPLRDWLLGTMDLRTERIKKDVKTVTITGPNGKTLLSQVFRRKSSAALPARDAETPAAKQKPEASAIQNPKPKIQNREWSEIDWSAHAYDFLGRKTLSRNMHRGITGQWRYNPCCNQVEWERRADTTEVTYQYDDLGRVTMQATKTPDGRVIETWNTYNVHGQLVEQRTVIGDIVQIATTSYDNLGHVIEQKDRRDFRTQYQHVHEPAAPETTILPGGATRITARYLDGQQKSLTGTAVVHAYYDYGVEPETHETWSETRQAKSGQPKVEPQLHQLSRPIRPKHAPRRKKPRNYHLASVV